MIEKDYIKTIKLIKSEILQSRLLIAKMANKELLLLYFKIGKMIAEKSAKEKWGTKTIQKLAEDLQSELNGLRGFSYGNLRKMKLFYEQWSVFINLSKKQDVISPLATDKLEIIATEFCPLATSKLEKVLFKANTLSIEQFIQLFINVSFTAHYEVLLKAKTITERIFYITKTAQNYWTVATLKQQLKNDLFHQKATFPNNFKETITQNKQVALNSFKDQYLLDFIALSDQEQDNERLLEHKIVQNIKKFLLNLGNDFAFMGNQYRLIVAEEEYFIDLLFFNRKLQALVAFELKTGKFKPEYLGKMNFYLSALDKKIKQKHENPSIGIILCKEKNNTIVEFSFSGFNKAMGVATYKTSNKLPSKFKDILPDVATLKKLID